MYEKSKWYHTKVLQKSIIFVKLHYFFFILSSDQIDISTTEGVFKGEIIEQLSLKFKTGCLSQCYLWNSNFFINNISWVAKISMFGTENVTIILWEHAHAIVSHDELSIYQSTLNYKHFWCHFFFNCLLVSLFSINLSVLLFVFWEYNNLLYKGYLE